MTFEKKLAGLFNLDDESWMRHANPWSVWTRFTVLPLILLAFWSRLWLGWWCLLPAVLGIIWVFVNPLVFPKPQSTRNWASRCVLGERVYLNRDKIPIPAIHKSPIYNILNGISFVGLLLAIWATVNYSVWGVVMGIALTFLGKGWFLDRMVWLYEDMKSVNEEYASWDY